MTHKSNSHYKELFLRNFKEESLTLLIGLILITFGLYIINWIYLKNLELEKINENTIDSKRGLATLMILPFGWFFTMLIFKTLIFKELPLIIGILEIVLWGLILFLILKYLYEFTQELGEISESNGIAWFLMFLGGIIGIICTALEFYYLAPLGFFLIITTLAIQSHLNIIYKTHTMKKIRKQYYN